LLRLLDRYLNHKESTAKTIDEAGRRATAKKQVFLIDFQTRADANFRDAVGQVHKGVWSDGREVAVKVLPEELFEGEERTQRFEREARLLASLNHPGIAAVYSFEEIPSPSFSSTRHVLVMELVEGDDLSAYLRAGPLSVEKSLSFSRQIAEALEAALAAFLRNE